MCVCVRVFVLLLFLCFCLFVCFIGIATCMFIYFVHMCVAAPPMFLLIKICFSQNRENKQLNKQLQAYKTHNKNNNTCFYGLYTYSVVVYVVCVYVLLCVDIFCLPLPFSRSYQNIGYVPPQIQIIIKTNK